MTRSFKLVFIAGAYIGQRGSIQHEDDFRYHEDGILMTRSIMTDYFRNNHSFVDKDRFLKITQSASSRQIYFVGLFMYSLLDRRGYDVRLVNCFTKEDSTLDDHLSEGMDVVLISTSFMGTQEVDACVKAIRLKDPDVPIIVGGRWVWSSFRVLKVQDRAPYSIEAVRENYFFTRKDPIGGVSGYIISPSGIKTLLLVLDYMNEGKDWSTLDNLCLQNGKNFCFNSQRDESIDIQDIFIDWSRIPGHYISTVLPIAFTLGCPFRCNFCNFPQGKFIRKPIDMIRKELRVLANTQRFAKSLWFIDDNILLNEKQIVEFCSMFKEEKFPFRWRSFIRADVITNKVAESLASSGCEMLIIGMESLNDRVLSAMGKKSTMHRLKEAIYALTDVGISAELSFIIGFPEENEASIAELSDFLANFPKPSRVALYYLYLFVFHLEPLAPSFEEKFRQKYNLEGYHLNWKHRTMDSIEASERLREVYLASNSDRIFLNYLDCNPSQITKHDLEIMAKREELSKAILRNDYRVNEIANSLKHILLS